MSGVKVETDSDSDDGMTLAQKKKELAARKEAASAGEPLQQRCSPDRTVLPAPARRSNLWLCFQQPALGGSS